MNFPALFEAATSRRELLSWTAGAMLAARRRPRGAPSTTYQPLAGVFTVVGKRPDGDSVRFIPDEPGRWSALKRSGRIDPSRDGSVQLRLEGLDTPEVHFGSEAQPLGAAARDALLAMVGFGSVRYRGSGSQEVAAATPPGGARGAVLAQSADANGRPLCYLFREVDAPWAGGERFAVDGALLGRSINARMLSEGHAYYAVYTSTPEPHRAALLEAARAARRGKRGVWARDVSRAFTLENQASLGPSGQLIFPKMFRRCTDYLLAVSRGFRGTLPEWFAATATLSRRRGVERVWVGGVERRFAELVSQRGTRVTFGADLLELVFHEGS